MGERLAKKPLTLPTLRFRSGETVYYAGDPAQAVMRLERGLLRLTRPNPEGRVYTLRHILPGDVFGEEALTSDLRTGSARALSEAHVAVIDPKTLSTRDRHIIACSLAAQLRRLTAFMCHLQTGNLKERVLRYLLALASTSLAKRGAAGQIVLRVTHEFLAEGTASTRESVSAVMMSLRAEGVVDTSYSAVTLHYPALLPHI